MQNAAAFVAANERSVFRLPTFREGEILRNIFWLDRTMGGKTSAPYSRDHIPSEDHVMSAVGLASQAVKDLQSLRKHAAAVTAGTPAPEPPTANTATSVDKALSALATYIPAEATALYLAVTSSLPQITTDCPWLDNLAVFLFFTFIVSPGLFALAYFSKLAHDNEPIPSKKDIPWFRFGSSILAFAVWALCIPGNPFSDPSKPGLGILFGMIATGVSITLPSVEAIYQWARRR